LARPFMEIALRRTQFWKPDDSGQPAVKNEPNPKSYLNPPHSGANKIYG